METITTWGNPLPETDRAPVDVDTADIFKEQWGELEIDLEFTPRNPTDAEYALVVSQFITEFSLEHPEVEIVYLEALKGSPHHMKVQFISHTNPLTWTLVSTFLITIFGFVLSKIVYIAIAAAVVMAGYALYKRLAPPTYECPVCGETFDSYETLVSHMQYEHPGAPIPDKPPEVPSWLYPALIGGGIIVAVAVVGPSLMRELTRKRKK